MTPIAPLIEAFLRETLSRQRGASRHTQDSYALSFQLLFVFAAGRLKVSPLCGAPARLSRRQWRVPGPRQVLRSQRHLPGLPLLGPQRLRPGPQVGASVPIAQSAIAPTHPLTRGRSVQHGLTP
jgi:hypothetical protein